MRVLLAAITADKGKVDANLERHVELLEQARSDGCDLVVFPEFSLTGSVDPTVRPEWALELDAEPVRELIAATLRSGVSAVFGIAERAGDAFHITQLYAHDGRLEGAYRKRHVAEDEVGYRPGTEAAVFRFGAATFGITVCAEGGVDFPWDDVAGHGASVLLYCSAPGLYGRRTDTDSWRRGHAWWEEEGLGNARRHARRLGVWVAMTTQAGVTEDEDFPGLAALVTPEGEVAARLPDWRPGTLTVDIPVDLTVHPVRETARALVVDPAGRALLARYAIGPATWWTTPGGGLEPGEDHHAAVRRELHEETGRDDLPVGPWIGRRQRTFRGKRVWFTQRERWALCRTEPFEVDPTLVASLRAEGILEMRWWSAAEIRSTGIATRPRDLVPLLDRVNQGDLPGPDTDLGL